MSLRFRDEYGQRRLDLPLFYDSFFGDSSVQSYNSLYLRAAFDDSWIVPDGNLRGRAQLIRDQWMRDSMLDMGYEDAGRGRFVSLFINGLYWGVYNLHERQEAAHVAEYHGGEKSDYVAVKGGEVVDGDPDAFNALRAVGNGTGLRWQSNLPG
ncbi:MAG: CotH kinase family protein [Candidatus Nealsonbacteria bacterium]|nr:CotH kinase family protein [Candidatus Nealsonbacteria bacterium]